MTEPADELVRMVEQLTHPPPRPTPTPPPVEVTRDDTPVVPPYTPAKPARSRANRRWLLFLVGLILVPLISATVMIGQHGFSFYVFRQAGVGETNGNGLNENQGPGQPDAPKPPVLRSVPVGCSAGCGTQGGG